MEKALIDGGFAQGCDGVWRKRHEWLTAQITIVGKAVMAEIATKTGTNVAEPDRPFRTVKEAVDWTESTTAYINSRARAAQARQQKRV